MVPEDELVDAAQAGRFDDPAFTDRERAAMRFGDAMHQRPRDVPTEVLAEVRSQFDDAEFTELAYCVAQFIGMGQLIHLLGVPNPDVVADGSRHADDAPGS